MESSTDFKLPVAFIKDRKTGLKFAIENPPPFYAINMGFNYDYQNNHLKIKDQIVGDVVGYARSIEEGDKILYPNEFERAMTHQEKTALFIKKISGLSKILPEILKRIENGETHGVEPLTKTPTHGLN